MKCLSVLAHGTCAPLWRLNHYPMIGALDLKAAGFPLHTRICANRWLLKGQESTGQATECCPGKTLPGIMPGCVTAQSSTRQVGGSQLARTEFVTDICALEGALDG